MPMRTQTGSGTAQGADGQLKGENGGQSPNCREIVKYISSEDQMLRLTALGKLFGNARALAYLSATADYSDIREAALKQLLKDSNSLFQVLEGMTGRCPQPWERELMHTLNEVLDGSNKVLGLKLWQLQNSKFSASGKCKGFTGEVDFVEETPVQFEAEFLARLIEETQA